MIVVTSGGEGKRVPLLDIAESINGFDTPPSGTSWNVVQRSDVPLRTAPGIGVVGPAINIVTETPERFRALEMVSNAGSRSVISFGTQQAVPLGRAIGASAQALPLPRPLWQYILTVPVRSVVRGTARFEAGFAATNGGISLLGTDPAIAWVSDTGVNGGRFTPQFRSVAAGAITTLVDSTIDLNTTYRTLGIRYTEAPVSAGGSLTEWTIDDVVIASQRNIPIFSAAVSGFMAYRGTSQVAGTTLRLGEMRLRIFELA